MKILLGIAVGIALGSFYSLISFVRCGIGCGAVITAVSDVLFGILSALVVFAFTFIFNSGVLRAYIIFSVILGFSVPLLLTEKLRCRIRRRNKKKGYK